MYKSRDFKLCNSNYTVLSTENLKNCKRSIALGKDDYEFHNVVHKYIVNSIKYVNRFILFNVFRSSITEPGINTSIYKLNV